MHLNTIYKTHLGMYLNTFCLFVHNWCQPTSYKRAATIQGALWPQRHSGLRPLVREALVVVVFHFALGKRNGVDPPSSPPYGSPPTPCRRETLRPISLRFSFSNAKSDSHMESCIRKSHELSANVLQFNQLIHSRPIL